MALSSLSAKLFIHTKTVEKLDAVVTKVLVCMEDDCIFLKFCV